MVYIFNSELADSKSITVALTNIFGLGKSISKKITSILGFSENLKVKELSKDQVNRLIKAIDSLDSPVASDLKNLKLLTFKQLLEIKSYKGLRRSKGLPVRGQRTHTNAKTSRKRF